MQRTLFERYPQLNNLRALVPDSLIEEEIGSRTADFEQWLEQARTLIPTVNLNKVFPEELERGSIRLENFLGHWGNVLIEELCKICLIVKWLQPKRILEIGTYNGMTTLQMALNAPADCTTYTLDLSSEQASKLELSRMDELIATQFKKRFQTTTGSYFANRNALNIVQLWGDSGTFDYSSIETPIDLIFIDAAHDYENKRKDSDTAFRILSPRGVILWHNYSDVLCPDVTKCLGELAQQKKLWHLRNTSLAVYFAGNN
jgi:hypothetical protein